MKRKFVGEDESRNIRRIGFRYIVSAAVETKMAQLGMSQKQLADKASMSSGNLSRILAGDRNMTIDTLFSLADSMNCQVNIELVDDKNQCKSHEFRAIGSIDKFTYSVGTENLQGLIPSMPTAV